MFILATQGSQLEPLPQRRHVPDLFKPSCQKDFSFSPKRISLLHGSLLGYPVTFSLCRSKGMLSECLGSFFLSIGIISNQFMLSLHLLSSQGLLEGFAYSGGSMILLALFVLSAGWILDPSMSCQILKLPTYNPLFPV